MPRDWIHCYVAEQCAAILREWSPSVADCLEHWRMGAVFPDAGFYMPYLLLHRTGSAGHMFAHDLHGSDGQDPNLLFRALRKAWRKEHHLTDLAFLFGCATHFLTDVVFHPFVYYHTGNYYDKALSDRRDSVYRHRLLETLMDFYLVESRKYQAPRLKEHWKMVEPSIRWVCTALEQSSLNYPEETFQPHLYQSMKLACRLNSTFSNPWMLKPVGVLRHLAPRNRSLALFYVPSLRQHLSLLQGRLLYLNPVTGEPFQCSFDDLLERAIKESVAYCKDALWPYLEAETDELPPMPSLDFGLVGARYRRAVHFAEKPLTAAIEQV
ncbi:MAG: zinc dependent phospholipase C family protein [Opitutales bacterium]|nr:zinc dependent phospholipase C family protein [Opitutales bacterium]